MNRMWQQGLFALVLVSMGISAYFSLQSPNGLFALMKKHEEIRELTRQNQELANRIEQKKARILRLQESRDEQELEIRDRLKLMRQGETTFVIPEEALQQSEAAKRAAD